MIKGGINKPVKSSCLAANDSAEEWGAPNTHKKAKVYTGQQPACVKKRPKSVPALTKSPTNQRLAFFMIVKLGCMFEGLSFGYAKLSEVVDQPPLNQPLMSGSVSEQNFSARRWIILQDITGGKHRALVYWCTGGCYCLLD
eukprot:1158326-Pelagomonas_calceolata.AAC.6